MISQWEMDRIVALYTSRMNAWIQKYHHLYVFMKLE
jgi:hypothetical protein